MIVVGSLIGTPPAAAAPAPRGDARPSQRGRISAREVYDRIFAALAEFERELIRERTVAGLKGRTGPRTQLST